MEELKPKRDGNGYQQASTSKDAPSSISNEDEMVNVSIPQQASIELKYEARTSRSSERRIQKVPAFLRRDEHNKSDYDPVVVSFGPYHHGRPELKFVENFKPKALELFVEGSGKDTDFFYNKVVEVIHDVRTCYVENSTNHYDDAAFARMMLHDACLLINMIDLDTKIQGDMIGHLGCLAFSLVYRDLLLLENQIPFWFLKLLLYLKYGQVVGEEKLASYMKGALNDGKFEHAGERSEEKEKEEKPLHLLEAGRKILVSDCSSNNEKTSHCSISEWFDRQSARIGEACHHHFLLKFLCLGKGETSSNRGFGVKSLYHSFRSVRDLKAKGIHFRSSATDSFKDIKFKSSYLYGKLELPTWIFTKNSKVFFLNVVAFELCPNTNTDLTVSSYINFMKSLIESIEDVKELREKQIIFSGLGSDEDVLRVFKDINTYDVEDMGMFYEIREKIQEHCNNKAKTWLAELLHTYFRSPWTAIALLAAAFLLCLTFLQTYFTIHSPSQK